MKALTTNRISFCILATTLLLFACSCDKEATREKPEASAPIRYLYAGGQGDNRFQMWIWIYEDETMPARVHSGMCRFIDNQYVDTDVEHLACQFSENGFTLSDPATGKVLYTATNVEKQGFSPGYHVNITWNHSPGDTWDAYAEEKGWLREMNLAVQICEGDDIVDY